MVVFNFHFYFSWPIRR